MSARWPYLLYIGVRAANKAAANTLASADWPGTGDNAGTFEAVKLEQISNPGVLYAYGCSVPCTRRMIARLRARLDGGQLPTLRYYLVRNGDSASALEDVDDGDSGIGTDLQLVKTNSASAQASVGQRWTFEQALADLGLRRMTETVTP